MTISTTLNLSAMLRTAMDAPATPKVKGPRILVIHGGTGEFSLHRQWDAAERSMKNLRRFAPRRQRGMNLMELEAMCETMLTEQTEVVIFIGHRSKRTTHFFLKNPAALIKRRTKIPMVVVK